MALCNWIKGGSCDKTFYSIYQVLNNEILKYYEIYHEIHHEIQLNAIFNGALS